MSEYVLFLALKARLVAANAAEASPAKSEPEKNQF